MLKSKVSCQWTAKNVTNTPTLRGMVRAGWRPENVRGRVQAWSPSLGFHLHILVISLTLWVPSHPRVLAMWLQVTTPVIFPSFSHRLLLFLAFPICAVLLRHGKVTGDNLINSMLKSWEVIMAFKSYSYQVTDIYFLPNSGF